MLFFYSYFLFFLFYFACKVNRNFNILTRVGWGTGILSQIDNSSWGSESYSEYMNEFQVVTTASTSQARLYITFFKGLSLEMVWVFCF
jgi:hypothetical protein